VNYTKEGNQDEQWKTILRAQLEVPEKGSKSGQLASVESEYSPQFIDSVRRAIRHATEELRQRHTGKVFIVDGRFQADFDDTALTTQQVDPAIGKDADFRSSLGRMLASIRSSHQAQQEWR
jgi:hypothetical protein